MPEGILNVIEPDACCSKRFQKAAQKGELEGVTSWTCPKCGVLYKPQMVNGCVRHWVADVYCELIRCRG
jgi:hypothetical protein